MLLASLLHIMVYVCYMVTCYIKGRCYMCSLSYKTNNNKVPTLNPKPKTEKKKTTKKNTKINLGFQSKLTSSKGV
jgi:hypothetical protein